MGEAGREQAVERLADFELDEAGLFDDLLHVPGTVEKRQERPLRGRQGHVGILDVGLVYGEDEIERRDLLLDQAPLVDAPGALEKEAFRVDRDQEVFALGTDARLEV